MMAGKRRPSSGKHRAVTSVGPSFRASGEHRAINTSVASTRRESLTESALASLSSLAVEFAFAEVRSSTPTLPAPGSSSVPTLPAPAAAEVPTLPAPAAEVKS